MNYDPFSMLDADDIIAAAEKEDGPPKADGPIPKQTLPGFMRWTIKLSFMPFIWMDQWTKKIARLIVKPPLKREGECLKRGNCCYFITMPAEGGFAGYLHRFWVTQVNGFYFRYNSIFVQGDRKIYVMGCRYLKEDGSCKHYFTRPTICREWPLIERFAHPKMLKGCGFRAVDRKDPRKIIE